MAQHVSAREQDAVAACDRDVVVGLRRHHSARREGEAVGPEKAEEVFRIAHDIYGAVQAQHVAAAEAHEVASLACHGVAAKERHTVGAV